MDEKKELKFRLVYLDCIICANLYLHIDRGMARVCVAASAMTYCVLGFGIQALCVRSRSSDFSACVIFLVRQKQPGYPDRMVTYVAPGMSVRNCS